MDLSAFGTSNGTNTFLWNRNGNEFGTIFVIEAAYDGTSDWAIIDTTTRSKSLHIDQKPGRMVRYRVFAQRGQTKSPPSGTAMVYDPGQDIPLQIAA